jgi:hypothetical protein
MINRWISMNEMTHFWRLKSPHSSRFRRSPNFCDPLLQHTAPTWTQKKSAQGKFAAGRFSSNWAEICEPSKIWHVSEWTPQSNRSEVVSESVLCNITNVTVIILWIYVSEVRYDVQ